MDRHKVVEAPAEVLKTNEEVLHLFERKDRIVQIQNTKAVIVNLQNNYQVELAFENILQAVNSPNHFAVYEDK